MACHAGFAQGGVKGLSDEFSNREGAGRVCIGTKVE